MLSGSSQLVSEGRSDAKNIFLSFSLQEPLQCSFMKTHSYFLSKYSLLLQCCGCSVQTWGSPSLLYFLVIHVLAAFAAVIEIHRSRFDQVLWNSPEITIGLSLQTKQQNLPELRCVLSSLFKHNYEISFHYGSLVIQFGDSFS